MSRISQGWVIFHAQKHVKEKNLDDFHLRNCCVVVGVGYNSIRTDENLIPNWSHGGPR